MAEAKPFVMSSFVLYTSYYDSMSEMSDEQVGKIMRVIFRYQKEFAFSERENSELSKLLSGLDATTRAVFMFIKDDLDRNNKKYRAKCQKNHDSASKSVEARRSKKEAALKSSQSESNERFQKSNERFQKSNERFQKSNVRLKTDCYDVDVDEDVDVDVDDDDDSLLIERNKKRKNKEREASQIERFRQALMDDDTNTPF